MRAKREIIVFVKLVRNEGSREDVLGPYQDMLGCQGTQLSRVGKWYVAGEGGGHRRSEILKYMRGG